MSSFIANDFRTSDYSDFRPRYPPEWYTKLNDFHEASYDLVVDVGCGPGTATTALKNSLPFHRVIGIDPSEPMIQTAKLNQEKDAPASSNKNKIEYYKYTAEELGVLKREAGLPMLDMITAAECAHWLDWQKFQKAAYSALTPGGTLALWGYVDPVFVDYPEFDEVIESLQYSDDTLGPYWEQPGRTRLRQLFRHVIFDPELFVENVITCYDPRVVARDSNVSYALHMEQTMTVEAFSRYIETWSSYHVWRKHHFVEAVGSAGNETSLSQDFVVNFIKTTGLSRDSHVRVAWKTVTCLARKRAE